MGLIIGVGILYKTHTPILSIFCIEVNCNNYLNCFMHYILFILSLCFVFAGKNESPPTVNGMLFFAATYSLDGTPGFGPNIDDGIDIFEIRIGTSLLDNEEIDWGIWSTPTNLSNYGS